MRIRNLTTLGAHVRQQRINRELTQQQLADNAGVSRRWIIDLERAQRNGLELDRLFKVLDALGLQIDVVESTGNTDPNTDRVLDLINANRDTPPT